MFDNRFKSQSIEHIKSVILEHLQKNQSLLWLVSGGSAIDIAVQIRVELGSLPASSKLHVGLVDERYGLVGHANSNFKQLMDAGFNTDNVILHPIILEGESAEDCAKAYNQTLEQLMEECDTSIGLFGIGADGHTGGILPHSSLASEAAKLVGFYQGPDFMRISITPKMIEKLDEAVLYAVGENKWPAIKQMLADGSIDEIPARILKTLKAYTIYTDYKPTEDTK